LKRGVFNQGTSFFVKATLAAAVPMQQSGFGSPTVGGQHQAQSRRGYEAMRPEH